MAPFLQILAPKELLMRFLSFGTKIIEFLIKFCMEIMILRIYANSSVFEDFGSSGALNEIFEFREQDFWIPRQILYGNGDFEDFCEWLNF